jgi:cell division transport system ATP-binding protein
MKLIEYKQVYLPIKDIEILKDVNFELYANQFIFLTGKIGTGKTSFLKSIYAEIPIISGSAFVMGFNLKNIKNKEIHLLRRKIGYVFQNYNFLNDRNIYENLKFVLQATGWKDKNKINDRITEVLEKVEMTSKKDNLPSEISGGELQSIAVARSILNYPNLILADEPTGNLDEQSAKKVTKLLSNLVNESCSVIYVTHNSQNFENVNNFQIYNIQNQQLTKI